MLQQNNDGEGVFVLFCSVIANFELVGGSIECICDFFVMIHGIEFMYEDQPP